MEAILATEEWQRAGVHYVRIEGMLKEWDFGLDLEFDTDTPEDNYILVLDGKFPVSTCRIKIVDENTGKIERVCTIGAYRHSGAGRLAVLKAEQWLKEKGVHHVVIYSRDVAVGFYEKLGYKARHDIAMEQNGPFPLVLVEKDICL